LADQPGQNLNRPGGIAAQIYQGLIARGFNSAQAAALTGNMQQESNFSTGALNPGEGAFGLIQWRNERRDNLNNFAAAQGKSPTDLGTQLDFVKHEMGTTEAGNSRAFLAATDVASANHALHQYIRYGDNTEGTRLVNAQAVAGGKFPAGGSVGSSAAAPGAPIAAQTPQTAAPPSVGSMLGQALGSMAAPSMGGGSNNAALAQAAPPAPGPQMAFRAAADDAANASNLTAGGPQGAGAVGQPGTSPGGMTGLLGLMADPTAQSQVQLPTDVPMTGMSGLLYSGGAGLGIRRPAVTRLT
jgi:Phage tail lysozyme